MVGNEGKSKYVEAREQMKKDRENFISNMKKANHKFEQGMDDLTN